MFAFRDSRTSDELIEMGIAPVVRKHWLEKSLPVTSKSAGDAVPDVKMSKKKKKKVRAVVVNVASRFVLLQLQSCMSVDKLS